jgi:hypothetical protein
MMLPVYLPRITRQAGFRSIFAKSGALKIFIWATITPFAGTGNTCLNIFCNAVLIRAANQPDLN